MPPPADLAARAAEGRDLAARSADLLSRIDELCSPVTSEAR